MKAGLHSRQFGQQKGVCALWVSNRRDFRFVLTTQLSASPSLIIQMRLNLGEDVKELKAVELT